MNGKFGWSYPPGAANDPNAPYNQDDFVIEDAIAGRDLMCPACQEPARWFRDVEKAGFPGDLLHDEVTEGWYCENCEWQQEAIEEDYDRLREFNKTYQPRVDAVNRAIANCKRKPALTLADISDHFPDGDFEWKDGCDGDQHVFCCGEKDCSQQWHLFYPYIDMGRKDGKRWVEIGTNDYGDQQPSLYWEDSDDFKIDKLNTMNGIGDDLANQSYNYFKGWAEYWLDCARTGLDPCDQIIGAPPKDWLEFCVKAAEDMAKYL